MKFVIKSAFYLAGSSIPSAFVLWVMRELPPPRVALNLQAESRTVTFVGGTPASVHYPQSWTAASRAQNQVRYFSFLDNSPWCFR